VDDRWDKFSSFEEYDAFLSGILAESKRVMKPDANIWVIATYHSIFRIGRIMQDLGYWTLNDVISVKSNPMPNWLGVRFTNATETLIWATASRDAKHYFDRTVARELGGGKVGANVWNIPICSGKERVRESNGQRLHSTQKPLKLLQNIMKVSTRPGDLLLDPMAGTGTSCVAAAMLGRHFLGIEREKRYAEAALKRIDALKNSKVLYG